MTWRSREQIISDATRQAGRLDEEGRQLLGWAISAAMCGLIELSNEKAVLARQKFGRAAEVRKSIHRLESQ
jgi:hypothetical protein